MPDAKVIPIERGREIKGEKAITEWDKTYTNANPSPPLPIFNPLPPTVTVGVAKVKPIDLKKLNITILNP